jgi:hypothetical protein
MKSGGRRPLGRGRCACTHNPAAAAATPQHTEASVRVGAAMARWHVHSAPLLVAALIAAAACIAEAQPALPNLVRAPWCTRALAATALCFGRVASPRAHGLPPRAQTPPSPPAAPFPPPPPPRQRQRPPQPPPTGASPEEQAREREKRREAGLAPEIISLEVRKRAGTAAVGLPGAPVVRAAPAAHIRSLCLPALSAHIRNAPDALCSRVLCVPSRPPTNDDAGS